MIPSRSTVVVAITMAITRSGRAAIPVFEFFNDRFGRS